MPEVNAPPRVRIDRVVQAVLEASKLLTPEQIAHWRPWRNGPLWGALMGSPMVHGRERCHDEMGRHRVEMHGIEHGMMGHHGIDGGIMEEE